MELFWQMLLADSIFFLLLGYWWACTRVELMQTIRLVEEQIRQEAYQDLSTMLDDKFSRWEDELFRGAILARHISLGPEE